MVVIFKVARSEDLQVQNGLLGGHPAKYCECSVKEACISPLHGRFILVTLRHGQCYKIKQELPATHLFYIRKPHLVVYIRIFNSSHPRTV